MIPPTAQAQIDAMCAREEVAFSDLIGSHLAEQHLVAARHRMWAALRAERDERSRPVYTVARIARWFEVAHSAVSQALRP
jgi:hypothetical protein